MDKGREMYSSSSFQEALDAFRGALACEDVPSVERQLLLSNTSACRLKIGGNTQNEAALQDAQQCVALNDRWGKGHVRLASAYVALGRSNDACNSLQRAIAIDPRNQMARNMLMKELRRDRVVHNNNNNDRGGGTTGTNSEQGRSRSGGESFPRPSAPPQPSTTTPEPSAPPMDDAYFAPSNEDSSHRNTTSTERESYYSDVDDTSNISFYDRVSRELAVYFRRFREWNPRMHEDRKSLLRIFVCIVILYVFFGGRFGLDFWSRESKTSRWNGRYGRENVYDHRNEYPNRNNYRNERYTDSAYSGRSSYGRYHDDSYHGYRDDEYGGYRRNTDDSYNYDRYGGRGSRSQHRSSYHGGGHSYGFDFLPLMMGILPVVYLAHRYGGVNPYHALMMLRMLGGGRRGRYYNDPMRMGMRGMRMGFGGMNGMGMGGGFGMGRGGFRRGHGRGGWF